mmetsp:Transcript_20965/g.31059  ORF Transcript_20965/g.31059 Transcript_20965/m.31059 type:complete len:203 (-) Transcript_20965:74-682(-)
MWDFYVGERCNLPHAVIVAVVVLALLLLFEKVTSSGIVSRLPKGPSKTTEKSEDKDGSKQIKLQEEKKETAPLTTAAPVWDAPETIQPLESESQWITLQERNETMILKFTAAKSNDSSKSIAPLFEKFCGQYAANFIEIDVDAFGDLASKYEVSVMPTFVVVFGDDISGKIRKLTGGSHLALQKFCQAHLVQRNINGKKHLY